MWDRINRWAIYGALASLLPLLFLGIALGTHGKLVELSNVWERGELILISATLLFSALGDLNASGGRMSHTKRWVGGICLISTVGLSVWYGAIVESLIGNQSYAKHVVSAWSPGVFLFALIMSLACVMLSGGSSDY